jgi:hypothetical protein
MDFDIVKSSEVGKYDIKTYRKVLDRTGKEVELLDRTEQTDLIQLEWKKTGLQDEMAKVDEMINAIKDLVGEQ